MNPVDIIQNHYATAILGGIGGIIITWLTQRVMNKRGTFSYFVNHIRVGVSAEDKIFGTVALSWNGYPIQNLFLSAIELTNESMNDYENVVVRAYTSDTMLLSEQTQILDTPNIIEWSEKYKKEIHVEPGQTPSDEQKALYYGQREYIIPIMNRGQKIKITYLNSAKSVAVPSIWLSVFKKGVKIKFRIPQDQILGIPKPHAAIAGVIIGVAVIFCLVMLIKIPWAIAIIALIYGLIAQLPGAYVLKLLRSIREAIGG
jgi:hypothetical protein